MTSLRATQPLARRPADPAAAGEFAAAVLAARQSVEVTVPGTEIRGRMRLLTHGEEEEVRADARRACQRLGVPEGPLLESSRDFLENVAVRTLSIAVRQVDNLALALAPIGEWQACVSAQIADLWQQYQDLEAALDPVGTGLTAGEAALLVDAAKKKDEVLLRSYGSRRLASFALTLVDPPAT